MKIIYRCLVCGLIVGKKTHSCPKEVWNKGKSPSQETRDKISLSKKGTIIKNHFTWKGKKRPPITLD